MLDSFAGHLGLVMGLSDEAVMDFARTRYGTHKALDNFNNVRFGRSALNVCHPLPSAAHVRMGLACLANDLGLASGSPLAPLLLADQLGGMLPAARAALRSPRL